MRDKPDLATSAANGRFSNVATAVKRTKGGKLPFAAGARSQGRSSESCHSLRGRNQECCNQLDGIDFGREHYKTVVLGSLS
jgi:hypothetical protein